MVRTASTMMPLGAKAPDFSLVDTFGKVVTNHDFGGASGLLVVFMCNHCPYVMHVAGELKNIADEYMPQGIAVVGINSNDTEAYPDDSYEKMQEEHEKRGYSFPYLLDEDQSVAKAYGAACTPDFFLFDKELRLVYRGQMDDSRPQSDKPVTGADLRTALDAVLAGKKPPENQRPSIGCNIKWRPGNEPAYFDPEGSGYKIS